MTTTVKIKRTTVSGRAANTTTLANAGELAINLPDGIMYSTDGSAVFEVGANLTNSLVTGVSRVGNSTVNCVANSSSIALSNSTVNFIISKPTAAQVANGHPYLGANGTWIPGITVGTTAPVSPVTGQLWVDTN